MRLLRTKLRRLTSITRSHSLRGSVSGGPNAMTPTLFMTISIVPNSSSVRSRTRSRALMSETLHSCAIAEPPAPTISCRDQFCPRRNEVGHHDSGTPSSERVGCRSPDPTSRPTDDGDRAGNIDKALHGSALIEEKRPGDDFNASSVSSEG